MSGGSDDPKKKLDVRFEDAQSNIKLIHANLIDINGYPQYMNLTSINRQTASGTVVGPLAAGPMKAFKGSPSGTVPEAVDISNMLSQNTEDFKNFFTQHVSVGDPQTENPDQSALQKETKDYGGIGNPGYGMLPG